MWLTLTRTKSLLPDSWACLEMPRFVGSAMVGTCWEQNTHWQQGVGTPRLVDVNKWQIMLMMVPGVMRHETQCTETCCVLGRANHEVHASIGTEPWKNARMKPTWWNLCSVNVDDEVLIKHFWDVLDWQVRPRATQHSSVFCVLGAISPRTTIKVICHLFHSSLSVNLSDDNRFCFSWIFSLPLTII